jgi:hypothetical protein
MFPQFFNIPHSGTARREGYCSRGGPTGVTADLAGIDLIDLNVSYGMSSMALNLLVPSRTVPLRVSGGASDMTIQRPAVVPVRVRSTGWASTIVFDGETQSSITNDLWLQSAGYEAATGRYDIEFAGNVSMVTSVQFDRDRLISGRHYVQYSGSDGPVDQSAHESNYR